MTSTPHSVIFIFLLIGGFFRSLQFTALNTIAYAEIPQELLSRANTLYNMMQQLTLSLGIAVGALLLNFILTWRGETQLGASDFWPAYLIVGAFSLASALSFLPLPRNAGDELSGHAVKVQVNEAAQTKDPA